MLSLAASLQESAVCKERSMLCEHFVKHKFNDGKQGMKFGIEHSICLPDA
jgi:hypothetical protein